MGGIQEPAVGISAGFGGPILHGLSTFGFVARGILAAVGGNDVNALKAFGCRFTSPVKPGGETPCHLPPHLFWL